MTREAFSERISWALALRCPRCGGSGILATWFTLKRQCPKCSLTLDRGENGYWLGAYAINVVFAEGVAAFAGLLALRIWWPETVAASVVAIALAMTLPFVFFPFARVLWLAIDLTVRSSEPGDAPK